MPIELPAIDLEELGAEIRSNLNTRIVRELRVIRRLFQCQSREKIARITRRTQEEIEDIIRRWNDPRLSAEGDVNIPLPSTRIYLRRHNVDLLIGPNGPVAVFLDDPYSDDLDLMNRRFMAAFREMAGPRYRALFDGKPNDKKTE